MKPIVGIMGPGEGASAVVSGLAHELGRLAALKGWVVLTGGRSAGVMHAALEGAKVCGGLTVGVLPFGAGDDISPMVDICVRTGMGEARNVVNVLTSDVVLVCGMSSGTASEVSFALKLKRPVILVAADSITGQFFASLGGPLHLAQSAEEAIERAQTLLAGR